jgi:hypothetical protein
MFAESDAWTVFQGNLPATLTALATLIAVVLAHVRLKDVKKNVETIEKATNSMHDALVAVTEKEALARGTAIGIKVGKEQRPRPGLGG